MVVYAFLDASPLSSLHVRLDACASCIAKEVFKSC
jgi:hypothetical protein